jgi:hypothetical protein
MAEHVQLEAEEPTGTAFAEVSPLVSEQAHPSMPNRLASWDRLTIQQIVGLSIGDRVPDGLQ